jgi:hypothetical protein
MVHAQFKQSCPDAPDIAAVGRSWTGSSSCRSSARVVRTGHRHVRSLRVGVDDLEDLAKR